MFKYFYLVVLVCSSVLSVNAQINTENLMHQARIQLLNEAYFDAIKTTTRVISYKSDLQDAYFYRGIAKFNLNDFQGAKFDFEYTIALNPFYSSAYHLLGKTEEINGNFSKALAYYKHTIKLSPYKYDVYLDRGLAYYRIKKYALAINDLDSALILNPSLPRAYFAKAYIEEELGDSIAALKNINKAIQLNPFMKEAFLKRATLWFSMANYQDALTDIDVCLKLDKNNPLAYFQRAVIYSKQEKFDLALADYNMTLALDNKNALAMYNRALLYYQTKTFDKAIDDFSMAAQINPDNILILYGRALVYYEDENFAKANADLSTIIKIYPLYSRAYLLRSMVYEKSGERLAANTDRLTYQKLSGILADDFNWAKDSAYVEEIIKFDGDFVDVDQVKSRKVQYQEVDARLKPDVFFMLRLSDYQNEIFDHIQEIRYQNRSEQMVYYLDLDQRHVDSLIAEYDNKEKDYLSYFILGTCYGLQNDYNRASSFLSESIKLNSSFAYAYANRAFFNAKLNEFSEELEVESQNLISLGNPVYKVPNHTESIQFVNENEIIQDYRKAANLRKDIMIQYNLANTLAINEKYIEGIYYYNQVLKRSRNFAGAVFNKAIIELKFHDYNSACQSLSRAGQLGEKDAYPLIKKFCK